MTSSTRPHLAALATAALGAAGIALAPVATATPAPGPDVHPLHDDGRAGAPSTVPAATDGDGSLVFIRDHDVWISRVDGTGDRALTRDGTFADPYLSPTQSDDGTVVAAHDERIVRMTSSGQVLNVIDPMPLENSAQEPMDGTPAYVAISADGALIAYTMSLYSCPSGLSCDTRFATAYTAADHLTDPARWGTTFYDAPAWVSPSRTVQGGGAFSEVNLHELGSAPRHWFRDSEIESPARDLSDPAVSPDGAWVATVRGYAGSTTILWSKVSGDVRTGTPGLPDPWCETGASSTLASPTFTADGTSVAWVYQGDLWLSVLDPGPTCRAAAKVADDVEQPSFSAARYTVAAPVSTQAPAVLGTARVGSTLRADTGSWEPAPDRLDVRWLRDGSPIRKATGPTYRPTAADRGHKIAVRVTATGAGGSSTATSKAVKVRG